MFLIQTITVILCYLHIFPWHFPHKTKQNFNRVKIIYQKAIIKKYFNNSLTYYTKNM